jgi:hypothetical protein
MQRLANAALQLFVLLVLKQHNPDPFGLVPIGHVPSKAGVVQLPPAELARAQL